MNKTNAHSLLDVLLIVGLALGYGGTTQFGPSGASKVRNARLQVGDEAPDFRLPDHTGGCVRLSDYLERRNVVIALYAWRGRRSEASRNLPWMPKQIGLRRKIPRSWA